jgi:reductive dehalogenase
MGDRNVTTTCPTCSPACASDEDARFEVTENFERFSQKRDIFSRSFWDSRVRSKESDKFYESYRLPLEEWRHVDGYHQKDFALRNAGWHVADFFAERLLDSDRREGFLDFLTAHRRGASEQRKIESPDEASKEIKKAAQLFGADMTGITYYDERWVYSHKYSRATENESRMDLPEGMTSVIVLVHEMDHDLLLTVPSALSGTATGIGYSKDVLTLLALAQYVRNLGYQAYASMNDTGPNIPYAIKAGLGEYGRHGMLITPELGPRLRIGKIFTDLPLAHDKPVRFGVEEFCNICRRCTDDCPPKAIPDDAPSERVYNTDAPSERVYNTSNTPGIKKWTTDAEKCFSFWVKQVTDCSICLRVCPYNRDYPRWVNKIRVRLMSSFLRRPMLWLDTILGVGKRKPPSWWWNR